MESPFLTCQTENPFIAMRNDLGIKFVPLTLEQIKIKNYVLCNVYINKNIEKTTSLTYERITKKQKEYLYMKSCGVLFCDTKKPLKKLRFAGV